MKKIIASLLLCAFSSLLVCSCAKNPEASSSTAAKPELSSTITTTSEISSEDESKTSLDSSSKKENNSSKKPTSSKKPANNSSSSSSQSVKVAPADRRCVVFCGMSYPTANSYGNTREDAFKEIADIAKAGYINSLSEREYLALDEYWDIVIKYDLTVWYSQYALFDSSKVQEDGTLLTLDEHLSVLYDIIDNHVKPYPERWERFNGFWYDEKIWRGQTNADFLAETKAIYQKYGKRNYAVLATGEFSGVEGNEELIGTKADEMDKILPSSFKYITDAGFDSYGIDVRDGAPNGNLIEKYQDTMPGIYDGESYYREYTELLLRLIGRDVNLWYLPCAYTCTVAGGLGGIRKADEGFCLGHLDFFYRELEERKYAGGLMLYVYGLSDKSENAGIRGLKFHLAVEQDGYSMDAYKIHPETPKWIDYSTRLRQIVKDYNSKKESFVRKI